MSNSQARREMKRRARGNVRRHYLLFIFICLIAAAIGTEFRSELEFLNLDSAQIDTVRGFLASFGREGFEADSRGVLAMAVNRVTSGTLTGIAQFAAGCGSFIVNKCAGVLFTYSANQGEVFSFCGYSGKPAGYMIVFAYCAGAYLIGWTCMKSLVPHYKKVEL